MRPGEQGWPVILVVDDDEYVHAAVRAVLRRTQATVVRAASAAEGRALAAETRPSLAIVDIGLPDGDGYELAADLKAADSTGGLRVLILTGHDPDRQAASTLNIDAVMGKPFRVHEFLATVERLLPPPAAVERG